MKITLTFEQLREAVEGFRYHRCVDQNDPHADCTAFGVELATRVEDNRDESIVLDVTGTYYYIRDAYDIAGKPLQSYGYQLADSLAELYTAACDGEAEGVEVDGKLMVRGIATEDDLCLLMLFQQALATRIRKFGS